MSDVRDPERDQVAPVPNSNPSCHDLVVEDLEERKAHGLRKYNSLLQPFNGRSFTLDIYEELLDATCYIRGKLEEERVLAAQSGTGVNRELFVAHAGMMCGELGHLDYCCAAPECGHNVDEDMFTHYAKIVQRNAIVAEEQRLADEAEAEKKRKLESRERVGYQVFDRRYEETLSRQGTLERAKTYFEESYRNKSDLCIEKVTTVTEAVPREEYHA